VPDPYFTQVSTTGLSSLAAALGVLDAHSDLNRRYRKLIEDSRRLLRETEIRQTQVRGIAKKLLVLAKAVGPEFRTSLSIVDRDHLDAGVDLASELLRETRPDS
jgi:hypothetical protein